MKTIKILFDKFFVMEKIAAIGGSFFIFSGIIGNDFELKVLGMWLMTMAYLIMIEKKIK